MHDTLRFCIIVHYLYKQIIHSHADYTSCYVLHLYSLRIQLTTSKQTNKKDISIRCYVSTIIKLLLLHLENYLRVQLFRNKVSLKKVHFALPMVSNYADLPDNCFKNQIHVVWFKWSITGAIVTKWPMTGLNSMFYLYKSSLHNCRMKPLMRARTALKRQSGILARYSTHLFDCCLRLLIKLNNKMANCAHGGNEYNHLDTSCGALLSVLWLSVANRVSTTCATLAHCILQDTHVVCFQVTFTWSNFCT